MKYSYHSPDRFLTDFVRTVLVVDQLSHEPSPPVPLVTAGMPALFFQFRSENITTSDDIAAVLFGNAVPPGFEPHLNHALVVAYFFNPFVAACIFDLPGKLLAKGPIDLMEWCDGNDAKLRRQLLGGQTLSTILETLNQFLMRQLERNRRACEVIRIATDRMMLSPGSETFSMLPEDLHVTQRTFQRMFKKYVGISPNEYRRICQFQQSFQQVRSRQFDRLSDVATDNGFADQSHFVRSFKEFTRTTPGKYLEDGLGKP